MLVASKPIPPTAKKPHSKTRNKRNQWWCERRA
ncbi:hypothetical protein JI435_409310 [Parastagonospora nodorum SN15]|uniref:Uncharacterized protein n=1 Tax=Phaeosphaeria nodorum (strain SN15 / ATCC MYA-4574 / FGSC 10173) TaxID=321614 RepID=A0A7U2HYI0_PHANO|nr:hypothetical protein JI435_409310 [Parastagonospora nodorum SN15]